MKMCEKIVASDIPGHGLAVYSSRLAFIPGTMTSSDMHCLLIPRESTCEFFAFLTFPACRPLSSNISLEFIDYYRVLCCWFGDRKGLWLEKISNPQRPRWDLAWPDISRKIGQVPQRRTIGDWSFFTGQMLFFCIIKSVKVLKGKMMNFVL